MAKTITSVQVIITGNPNGNPTRASVQYEIDEDGSLYDGFMRIGGPTRPTDMPRPEGDSVMAFNGAMTLHNSGAPGEFWRDVVDQIKTKEGIV